MLKNIVMLIAEYCIGCLNGALLYSYAFKHQDIRQYGSGNAGSTNVLRVYGLAPALCVFAFDAIKGVLGMLLCYKVCGRGDLIVTLCALAIVCGHNWPVFTHYKGGKGIATTFGIALTMNPWIAVPAFTMAMLILAITRIMALGTVTAVLAGAVAVWIFPDQPLYARITIPILFLMTAYQHRGNIVRIIKGQENKFEFGKKE